jgi:hypothetical protein
MCQAKLGPDDHDLRWDFFFLIRVQKVCWGMVGNRAQRNQIATKRSAFYSFLATITMSPEDAGSNGAGEGVIPA